MPILQPPKDQCIPIILMFHVIVIQHETLKHYSEFEPKNRILDSIVIVNLGKHFHYKNNKNFKK